MLKNTLLLNRLLQRLPLLKSDRMHWLELLQNNVAICPAFLGGIDAKAMTSPLPANLEMLDDQLLDYTQRFTRPTGEVFLSTDRSPQGSYAFCENFIYEAVLQCCTNAELRNESKGLSAAKSLYKQEHIAYISRLNQAMDALKLFFDFEKAGLDTSISKVLPIAWVDTQEPDSCHFCLNSSRVTQNSKEFLSTDALTDVQFSLMTDTSFAEAIQNDDAIADIPDKLVTNAESWANNFPEDCLYWHMVSADEPYQNDELVSTEQQEDRFTSISHLAELDLNEIAGLTPYACKHTDDLQKALQTLFSLLLEGYVYHYSHPYARLLHHLFIQKDSINAHLLPLNLRLQLPAVYQTLRELSVYLPFDYRLQLLSMLAAHFMGHNHTALRHAQRSQVLETQALQAFKRLNEKIGKFGDTDPRQLALGYEQLNVGSPYAAGPLEGHWYEQTDAFAYGYNKLKSFNLIERFWQKGQYRMQHELHDLAAINNIPFSAMLQMPEALRAYNIKTPVTLEFDDVSENYMAEYDTTAVKAEEEEEDEYSSIIDLLRTHVKNYAQELTDQDDDDDDVDWDDDDDEDDDDDYWDDDDDSDDDDDGYWDYDDDDEDDDTDMAGHDYEFYDTEIGFLDNGPYTQNFYALGDIAEAYLTNFDRREILFAKSCNRHGVDTKHVPLVASEFTPPFEVKETPAINRLERFQDDGRQRLEGYIKFLYDRHYQSLPNQMPLFSTNWEDWSLTLKYIWPENEVDHYRYLKNPDYDKGQDFHLLWQEHLKYMRSTAWHIRQAVTTGKLYTAIDFSQEDRDDITRYCKGPRWSIKNSEFLMVDHNRSHAVTMTSLLQHLRYSLYPQITRSMLQEYEQRYFAALPDMPAEVAAQEQAAFAAIATQSAGQAAAAAAAAAAASTATTSVSAADAALWLELEALKSLVLAKLQLPASLPMRNSAPVPYPFADGAGRTYEMLSLHLAQYLALYLDYIVQSTEEHTLQDFVLQTCIHTLSLTHAATSLEHMLYHNRYLERMVLDQDSEQRLFKDDLGRLLQMAVYKEQLGKSLPEIVASLRTLVESEEQFARTPVTPEEYAQLFGECDLEHNEALQRLFNTQKDAPAEYLDSYHDRSRVSAHDLWLVKVLYSSQILFASVLKPSFKQTMELLPTLWEHFVTDFAQAINAFSARMESPLWSETLSRSLSLGFEHMAVYFWYSFLGKPWLNPRLEREFNGYLPLDRDYVDMVERGKCYPLWQYDDATGQHQISLFTHLNGIESPLQAWVLDHLSFYFFRAQGALSQWPLNSMLHLSLDAMIEPQEFLVAGQNTAQQPLYLSPLQLFVAGSKLSAEQEELLERYAVADAVFHKPLHFSFDGMNEEQTEIFVSAAENKRHSAKHIIGLGQKGQLAFKLGLNPALTGQSFLKAGVSAANGATRISYDALNPEQSTQSLSASSGMGGASWTQQLRAAGSGNGMGGKTELNLKLDSTANKIMDAMRGVVNPVLGEHFLSAYVHEQFDCPELTVVVYCPNFSLRERHEHLSDLLRHYLQALVGPSFMYHFMARLYFISSKEAYDQFAALSQPFAYSPVIGTMAYDYEHSIMVPANEPIHGNAQSKESPWKYSYPVERFGQKLESAQLKAQNDSGAVSTVNGLKDTWALFNANQFFVTLPLNAWPQLVSYLKPADMDLRNVNYEVAYSGNLVPLTNVLDSISNSKGRKSLLATLEQVKKDTGGNGGGGNKKKKNKGKNKAKPQTREVAGIMGSDVVSDKLQTVQVNLDDVATLDYQQLQTVKAQRLYEQALLTPLWGEVPTTVVVPYMDTICGISTCWPLIKPVDEHTDESLPFSLEPQDYLRSLGAYAHSVVIPVPEKWQVSNLKEEQDKLVLLASMTENLAHSLKQFIKARDAIDTVSVVGYAYGAAYLYFDVICWDDKAGTQLLRDFFVQEQGTYRNIPYGCLTHEMRLVNTPEIKRELYDNYAVLD